MTENKYRYYEPEEFFALPPDERKRVVRNSQRILKETLKDYPEIENLDYFPSSVEELEQEIERQQKFFHKLPLWKKLKLFFEHLQIRAYVYLST